MNNTKYTVSTCVNFNSDITVIKQLQINKYGIEKYLYGLIDAQFEVIVPCECQYFVPIEHGLICTVNRYGNIGILNQVGNFLVPFSRGY